MASMSEKAQCVLWFHERKQPSYVQRQFRNKYKRTPPCVNTIKSWYRKFQETGSVADRKRSGRPRMDVDSIDAVRDLFDENPRISSRQAATYLDMPQSSVMKILHKELHLRPYKIQRVQALMPDDRPRRVEFANLIHEKILEDSEFLNRIMFSDEATFHVSGKVNRHNVRIWGSENPRVLHEEVRDSPKVNVWCGMMNNIIIGPFFFGESTITSSVYLDMLQQFVEPQVEELQPSIIFQQDGAPPHWGLMVRDYLNSKYPNRWIGRDGPMRWPPRSPDLTPLDFFCGVM